MAHHECTVVGRQVADAASYSSSESASAAATAAAAAAAVAGLPPGPFFFCPRPPLAPCSSGLHLHVAQQSSARMHPSGPNQFL